MRPFRFYQLDCAWSSTVPFRPQLWRCLQMRKMPRGYSTQSEFTPLVSQIQSQGDRTRRESSKKKNPTYIGDKKAAPLERVHGGCFQCGRKSTHGQKQFFTYDPSPPPYCSLMSFSYERPIASRTSVLLYRIFPV